VRIVDNLPALALITFRVFTKVIHCYQTKIIPTQVQKLPVN